jgi:hypothetical protein
MRDSRDCRIEKTCVTPEKQKANIRSPSLGVVGADGIEPPTYAL